MRLCMCVSSWFRLALCLVQSDKSDVRPGGLHFHSTVSMRSPVRVCVFAAELVFVLVPAAPLLTGNAGNTFGSDTTPRSCLASQTLMRNDGVACSGQRWGQ